MVTCTTPPFRAAVRLNSGVRPMRSYLLAATVTALLVGCASPADEPLAEDFRYAFEKMQEHQTFLEARTLPDFKATQEFDEDGDTKPATRPIPCSISEMHSAGWDVLPNSEELALTDATYFVESGAKPLRATVVLGIREGVADARYFFEERDGKWYLARMEIYSYAPPGEPLPALPCMPKA